MSVLYIVSTPIGNLSDFSPRAIETLKNVDLIAAEDTRVTLKILNFYDIHTPITSYHKFNEIPKSKKLVEEMLSKDINIALTTDAGTPAISDPGSILVAEAVKNGIKTIPIPGVSAVITALSISGFIFDEFTFYGFLPKNKSQLENKLIYAKENSKISIFYESANRLKQLLIYIKKVDEAALITANKELTKLYEKTYRGSVNSVYEQINADESSAKGEYCIVVKWSLEIDDSNTIEEISLEAKIFDCIIKELDNQEIVKKLTLEGEKRNRVYNTLLKVNKMLNK